MPRCCSSMCRRIDDDVKGTAVYAFVTLSSEADADREAVKKALVQHVRGVIGSFAVPQVRPSHFAPNLESRS